MRRAYVCIVLIALAGALLLIPSIAARAHDNHGRQRCASTCFRAEATRQIVRDGNFEDPSDGGANRPAWVAAHTGKTPLPALVRRGVHKGKYALLLGGNHVAGQRGTATAWQQLKLPKNVRTAQVSFWYTTTADACGAKNSARQMAFIATPNPDRSWAVRQTALNAASGRASWTHVVMNLKIAKVKQAGFNLAFRVDQPGCWASLEVDDVSLTVTVPNSPTPTDTPTVEETATDTDTPTATDTPTDTPTSTSTGGATDTPIATATEIATQAPTLPPVPSDTPTQTPTETPTPTATLPLTAILVTATVSNAAPPQQSDVTVTGHISSNGQALAGVPMHAVWHFPDGDQSCDAVSDDNGDASCTLNVDDAPVDQVLHISVYFTAGDKSFETETGFITQP